MQVDEDGDKIPPLKYKYDDEIFKLLIWVWTNDGKANNNNNAFSISLSLSLKYIEFFYYVSLKGLMNI